MEKRSPRQRSLRQTLRQKTKFVDKLGHPEPEKRRRFKTFKAPGIK